jgi:hypothetical protein
MSATGCGLPENRANQQPAAGTNGRSRRSSFCKQDPRYECPMQATLLVCAQAPVRLPEITWIFSLARARSGWFKATGPSMSATLISARPFVRSIKALSLTRSKGCIGNPRFWSVAASAPTADIVRNAEPNAPCPSRRVW